MGKFAVALNAVDLNDAARKKSFLGLFLLVFPAGYGGTTRRGAGPPCLGPAGPNKRHQSGVHRYRVQGTRRPVLSFLSL